MRNYISVNAKYYKEKELGRIIRHNFRLEKPDYLLSEESIKGENLDMIFNKDGLKTQNYKLLKEAKAEHLYNVFHHFKKARDEVYKNKKYYGNKNSNDIIEMVVALSEEQALNYLEKGESMMDGLENFAQIMKKEYGLQPMAISLHLDEGFEQNEIKNNIHFHVVFFNFDFEQERSRWRNITRSDTSRFQDLAQKSFQEKGYNFIRGESKEISGKQHLKRNDFILAKQKQQLENYDLILKSLIPEVNEEKKDLKSLLNTFNKDSVEYNLVYNLVGSTMNLEKELRKYSKIEDFNKENKDEIIKLLKRHLEKVKPVLGKDFYKLENSNALIDNLEKFVQKISNVNLEFTENQEKDKVIKDLESKLKEKDKIIEDKDNQNNIILDKLNEERSKNKTLEQDNLSKTNEITKLKENHKLEINKLQNDFKRKSRTNTRLRNQRNKYFQKLMRDNNLTKAMQTRKFLKDNKTKSLNKSKIEKKQESYDFER